MKRALPTRRLALCIIVATIALNPASLFGAPAKGKVISEKAESGARTTTITGTNVHYSEGGMTVLNNGASDKALSAAEKRLNQKFDALEKKLDRSNWPEIERDPFFRTFARNKYKKEIEQLTPGERASFGKDFSGYLADAKKAAADFQKIYQQIKKDRTVSAERKALFDKIEVARNNFDYKEVDRLLEEHRKVRQNALRKELAQDDYLQGQNYELQINYPEAERYYQKAAINEDQNPLYLNAYAGILWKSGKYHEAEPLYRRALAIREKQLGPDHPDVATSLNNLAVLLKAQGKYTEAEPLYRRALAIDEKALGSEHPGLATDLNNLALLLNVQGKYAEAEPLYRRALVIYEKQLGIEHPWVATGLNNLAVLLDEQGKYAEAEPLYRRALEINEKQLGPNHPDVATSLNNLASLLDDQGKYAEAEPLYRRALAIREKQLGPNHPDVATSLNNLAALLQAQGKYAEAEPLYRRALVIYEKQLGIEHPWVATGLNNLAELLREQGKYAEAEPLYRRAVAILEKSLGSDHPNTKQVKANLNTLLEEMKQKPK